MKNQIIVDWKIKPWIYDKEEKPKIYYPSSVREKLGYVSEGFGCDKVESDYNPNAPALDAPVSAEVRHCKADELQIENMEVFKGL